MFFSPSVLLQQHESHCAAMRTALCSPHHHHLHHHHYSLLHASSPLRPISPLSLHPCLNLLKCICGLTALISRTRHRGFYASQALSWMSDGRPAGSLCIPTPWRGVRGSAILRAANTVMFYTRQPRLCVCPVRSGYVHRLTRA